MFDIKKTLFTTADVDVINILKNLPTECYYLEHNGHIYHNVEEIGPHKLIQLRFRLLGGKGGFGSLLRSFRIHKSTNQLMCRDLSGRRLADIKEEERLQRWIKRKEEREREKQRKKQEKLERLKRGPVKHEFNDQTYLRARDHIIDQTEDAIEAGMRALEEKSKKRILSANNVKNASSLNGEEPDSSDASSSSSETSSSGSAISDDYDIYDGFSSKISANSNASKTSDSTKNVGSSRKRKRKIGEFVPKRLKVEYTSSLIFEYFTEQIISEIAQLAYYEAKKKLVEQIDE